MDRGKQGIKRSTVVDAEGIPLGTVAASANHHDSPLLGETLDALEVLGPLPEQMRVHLGRGYDSETTREKLRSRGFSPEISDKGKPALLQTGKRWVVERSNSWHNAYKKLVWCTEAGSASSTSGSHSPKWSSSCAGSSEKLGLSTIGRDDPIAAPDLLTQALSKSDTGQVNETLCKMLAHNICVLVHAIHGLGIEPIFVQRRAKAKAGRALIS